MNRPNTTDKNAPGPTRVRKFWSVLGWSMVVFAISSTFAIAAAGYWNMRQAARRASCANDLKTLGMILTTYAGEHDGHFPPISERRGNLMMDPKGIYPELVYSSHWVQCEYSKARKNATGEYGDLGPSAFNDGTLFYLPWEIANEKEGIAFVEAYKTLDLSQRENDLPVTIDGEQRTLPRVRKRSLSGKDLDSPPRQPTPIVVEWPHSRHPDMCVLYSDGSVETMKWGAGFPMSDPFIAALRGNAILDGPLPSD